MRLRWRDVMRSIAIQRSRSVMFGWRPRLGEQHLVDRAAGGIGCVRDAPHGVAAFTGEVQPQRAAGVGRERHALVDQPLHGSGAVFGDEARGVLVDQAGAGVLRVAHVRVDAVVAAQHADDAALRPCGGASDQVALGQHDHRPAPGQLAAPPSGRPARHRSRSPQRSLATHSSPSRVHTWLLRARRQRHRCHTPTARDGRPASGRGAL